MIDRWWRVARAQRSTHAETHTNTHNTHTPTPPPRHATNNTTHPQHNAHTQHDEQDLLNMNPLYGEQFRTLMSLTGSIDLNDLSRLVDAAASLTSADDATLQGILEQLDVPKK